MKKYQNILTVVLAVTLIGSQLFAAGKNSGTFDMSKNRASLKKVSMTGSSSIKAGQNAYYNVKTTITNDAIASGGRLVYKVKTGYLTRTLKETKRFREKRGYHADLKNTGKIKSGNKTVNWDFTVLARKTFRKKGKVTVEVTWEPNNKWTAKKTMTTSKSVRKTD